MNKTKTYIGKTYIPNDNSYCIDKTHNVSGWPYGRRMLIVSEPYKRFVETWPRGNKKEAYPFIDVMSYDTGIVYSVLFYENRVGEAGRKFIAPSGVIGKYMKVEDNSFLYCLKDYVHGSDKNISSYLYEKSVKIISEPYVDRMYYKHDEDVNEKRFYSVWINNENRLFVTVLYNGTPYRVLFKEWWLE